MLERTVQRGVRSLLTPLLGGELPLPKDAARGDMT